MIKFRSGPGIHGVTALAGHREAAGTVIQYRGCESFGMAGVAICAEADELPCGGIHVAVFALSGGVRSN